MTQFFAIVRDQITNDRLAIRCGKALLALALAALFLVLYFYVANVQSGVNNDLRKHDQSAYMIFTVKAYQTNFSYTGGRNRMPLYPFIQALFYSPDLDEEAFFEQGKKLNVGISILCLIAARGNLRYSSRNPQTIAFVVIFHVIYALSFMWYMPIIGNGSRTILSLMIPFLWTIGLLLHSASIVAYRIPILRWRFRASTLVYSVVLLTLIYEIYQVIDYRAFIMSGGN